MGGSSPALPGSELQVLHGGDEIGEENARGCFSVAQAHSRGILAETGTRVPVARFLTYNANKYGAGLLRFAVDRRFSVGGRTLTKLKILAAVGSFLVTIWALPLGELAAQKKDNRKADPAAGKAKYETLCAGCHGVSGKGDGPAATALNPKPRNYTDKKSMSTIKDEDIFKIIKEGGAAVGKSQLMPPWGTALSGDDIRNITAYIRTFAK